MTKRPMPPANKAKPRRKPARPRPQAPEPFAREPAAAEPTTPLAPDDRVVGSALALHDLFQQQTARMLERADLSEEQKQSILIGMSCPCCGAGGFSFTAKLKRGK
jgi:hypothetical protein